MIMPGQLETMANDPYLARVQAIVTGIAGPAQTPPDAGPDTPLGTDGFWLDSITTLEVILACEEEFGVTLDWEADLTPTALSTIRSFAEAVRKRASNHPR